MLRLSSIVKSIAVIRRAGDTGKGASDHNAASDRNRMDVGGNLLR